MEVTSTVSLGYDIAGNGDCSSYKKELQKKGCLKVTK